MSQKQGPVELISKEVILAPSHSYPIMKRGKWVAGIPVARDVTAKNKQTLVYA